MRVLVVSDTPFLPAAAGNRARITRMLAFLRDAGHDVGMLLLQRTLDESGDEPAMRETLDWLEVARADEAAPDGAFERARTRVARAARRLTGPAAPPIGVDDWCPPWFRARARDRIRAWRPDVVLVEYVFLSACLEPRDGDPAYLAVIDTHDVMHRRRALYGELGMAPQWFHTTAAEERRGLLRADLVVAIQDDEAAAFRSLAPERRVVTVPHAHPPSSASPEAARSGRLLVVASYNDVNVRGIGWLADAVWPVLRAARPDVELVICGNVASKLGPLPDGMQARGFVPRLDDEYAAARVVVSPVLAGTGLVVKTVEALCHARPVVSTRAGAAGLDAGEAHGVLVADDAVGFAAAVLALLDDDGRWRAAAAAAAHAARRFAPEAVFAPFVAELERLRPR